MIEINKIHCMDCLEGMQRMETNSIDVVITSPPYNLGKTFRAGKEINLYDDYSDNLNQEEYYEFIKKVLKELIRVTKRYIFFNFQILSNNKLSYLRILSEFKNNIKDIIIWHKKQWQPSIQPTCLSSSFEFIIIFAKEELCKKRSFETAFFNNKISGQQTSNVIYGNSASVKEFNTEQGNNKAVFPKYFVRWFINKFTKENDLILDPFMGTGTTAVVCKENNRKFIGFELSKEYCNICERRLEQDNLNSYI